MDKLLALQPHFAMKKYCFKKPSAHVNSAPSDQKCDECLATVLKAWIGKWVETDTLSSISYMSMTGMQTTVAQRNTFRLIGIESDDRAVVADECDDTHYFIDPASIRKLAEVS